MKFEPNGKSILSVSELTRDIKSLLEDTFSECWIGGEISNFKRHHRSGHCYFTLKDAEAQLRCVMWRGIADWLFFTPRDGMQVYALGDISVYEPRGEYQLVVRAMQIAGEGALQQAFEALKAQLEAEGLFDNRYKKPLPSIPETIGVITSNSGAALHDIFSILERRFPAVRVLVHPVSVQGPGAAEEIATAIRRMNALARQDPAYRADVLIVGRGGGSLEDLWAFNEEVVARAIFDSEIPVVSAVGHQIDFSIADFVADCRAATPSMAAELVVPEKETVEEAFLQYAHRMREELLQRIEYLEYHVARIAQSYAFNRPRMQLEQITQRIEAYPARLRLAVQKQLSDHTHRLEHLAQRLELLNPKEPLKRGYVCVEKDGQPIASSTLLQPGDRVHLRFLDGSHLAEIQEPTD